MVRFTMISLMAVVAMFILAVQIGKFKHRGRIAWPIALIALIQVCAFLIDMLTLKTPIG